MLIVRLFVFLGLALLASPDALAQLPREGVVFDDFVYESTTWQSELDHQWNPAQAPQSVFGRTTWTTPRGRAQQRLWYRYMWQEQPGTDPDWTLHADPTDGGTVTFSVKGRRKSYEAEGDNDRFPRQIVTGFARNRGTWAARVSFGDLAPADRADLIQAFWLVSPHSVYVNPERPKEWSEVDFEWNNRFLGTRQAFHYLSTGHTAGDGPIHGPLFAPAVGTKRGTAPEKYVWTCRTDVPGAERILSGASCTSVAQQEPLILLIQVTDAGVFYSVRSDGPGTPLVAHSNVIRPAPNLPMMAVFSQHIPSDSRVREREDFVVDWFYYSPSTSLSIEEVRSDVRHLRSRGIDRYTSVPALSLERPQRYLAGEASTYGMGTWTTPLSLDLRLLPSSMRPGETTRLTALPPLRHGYFRFSWRYRSHQRGGTYSAWRSLEPGSYEGSSEPRFTFPADPSVDFVEVQVTLDELHNPKNPTPIRNEIIRPVTERFIIHRASR